MENQDNFIEEYGIDPEVWVSASASIEELRAIEEDYKARLPDLKISAEYFANTLQSINSVHSVRWRTKDPKHLIRKIVRKKASKVEKYLSINCKNYRETITDLIGIRAIHLFKEDLIEIDREVRKKWDIRETPTIYVREGDQNCPNIIEPFERKVHQAGYRSAHYLVESKPTKETVVAELQVRTIFEEGWSEIDHTLRYPDHSNDQDIQSILTLFNRIAGSADEIASFSLRLRQSIASSKTSIENYQKDAEQYKSERDASFNKIESLLKELDNHKSKGNHQQDLIDQLRQEMKSMQKRDTAIDPVVQIKSTPAANQSDAGKIIATLAAMAWLASKSG